MEYPDLLLVALEIQECSKRRDWEKWQKKQDEFEARIDSVVNARARELIGGWDNNFFKFFRRIRDTGFSVSVISEALLKDTEAICMVMTMRALKVTEQELPKHLSEISSVTRRRFLVEMQPFVFEHPEQVEKQ